MVSVEGFDSIPEIFPCPVCLDLPVKKVFQCRNGHILCEECYTGQKICPTCRLPFDSEPIRSLAVELLLNGLNFHMNCLYETNGCKMRMNNLTSFRDHAKSCSFRFGPSISVCKNLGYPNCSFKMNGATTVEEAIHHFETVHEAVTRDADRVEVEFTDYAKFSGGSKLFILNQKANGYACLIRATHSGKLNWSPLYMRYPTLGDPSGVDPTQRHFITSSLPVNPKPDVFFCYFQPLVELLNYRDSSVANKNQRGTMKSSISKKILKCLKGTSESLVVSVEVREVRKVSAGDGDVPHVIVAPNEMKRNGEPELDPELSPKAPTQDPSQSPIADSAVSPNLSQSISIGPAESAVSLKLDKIPDMLLCPVCRELPVRKAFQCRNGHIICEECKAKGISRCSQCFSLFDKPPIRSLAVEMLMHELSFKFNCRYERFGCNLKMDNPTRFLVHIKYCNYRFGRPVNVCKGLGFETCSLQMNPGTTVEAAIEHFRAAHGAVTGYTSTLEVEFSDYVKFSGETNLIILNDQVNGYACLILARHNAQRLNWAPYYLQYPTLGKATDFDLTRTYLMTSSLSGHHESKVRYECCQPVWDILKSPDRSSLPNLYEMLNVKTVTHLEEPCQSLVIRTGVAGTGIATKDCKQIPRITLTPPEMTMDGGSNIKNSILGSKSALEKVPQSTPAKCSSSCAATNKGTSTDHVGKNTKRNPNSKSGCVIV